MRVINFFDVGCWGIVWDGILERRCRETGRGLVGLICESGGGMDRWTTHVFIRDKGLDSQVLKGKSRWCLSCTEFLQPSDLMVFIVPCP